MEGKTQVQSAALASMSVRSARRWQEGELPSTKSRERDWRTRSDPFSDVWQEVLVPLLENDPNGVLTGPVLLEHLRGLKPENADRYPERLLRTLQRRIRSWRALHSEGRAVVFPQEHPVGREAAFDFTHCDELAVTIGGELFPHLLFTFTLSYSRWRHVSLAFSETFEALLSGLQNALWTLGGCPEVLRHDNLSAATKELKRSGGRSLTRRFATVLEHYGARSTRIKPGRSQENGGAEKTNDVVKSGLRQALILRGSANFTDVDAYMRFVDTVLSARNRSHATRHAEELSVLRPLPQSRLPDYTEFRSKVRRWSTIHVAGRIYSVPSRLIGHQVVVHQYAQELLVYFGGELTERFPRLRGDKAARVDYRHIIWSLIRKPGAFARYRFREELFPNLTWRRAYDALVAFKGERADIEYVRILHLAAATMECVVEQALEQLLLTSKRFDYAQVKQLAAPDEAMVPEIAIAAPDLTQYDRLLEERV